MLDSLPLEASASGSFQSPVTSHQSPVREQPITHYQLPITNEQFIYRLFVRSEGSCAEVTLIRRHDRDRCRYTDNEGLLDDRIVG